MTGWHQEDLWFQPWWRHLTQSLNTLYQQQSIQEGGALPPLVCVTQGYNEKRTPLIWVRKQPGRFWWRYATVSIELIVRIDAECVDHENSIVAMVRQCIQKPYQEQLMGSCATFHEKTAVAKMSDSRWKETRLEYEVRVSFPRGVTTIPAPAGTTPPPAPFQGLTMPSEDRPIDSLDTETTITTPQTVLHPAPNHSHGDKP